MSKKVWLNKKPDTVLDWIGIVFASIGFYLLLGNLDFFFNMGSSVLSILSPFAGGILLAYMLDPIVRYVSHKFLHDNKKMRWIAIVAAYIVAVLLIVALVSLVVPQIVSSVTMLFNNIPGYIQNVQDTLLYLQANYGVDLTRVLEMLDDYEAMLGQIYGMLTNMAPQIMGYVGSFASNTVAIFTAVASSVYMLADKDRLLYQLRMLAHAFLPREVAANTLRICKLANQNFSGFFVGKIVDSVIIWLITFIIMQLLRMNFAPLISVVVGVTNIIPVFGPFIGAVPGLVILLFVDPVQALEFLVLIIVIQQVDGNFIGPKILGQSIGLSALWVLFSIILGGDLFGVVGMVLGVPVFATFYALLRQAVYFCLERRGLNPDGTPVEGTAEAPAPQEEPVPSET